VCGCRCILIPRAGYLVPTNMGEIGAETRARLRRLLPWLLPGLPCWERGSPGRLVPGAATCAVPGAREVGILLPNPAALHPEAIPQAGAAHRVFSRRGEPCMGDVSWEPQACEEASCPAASGATGHCTGPQGCHRALGGHPDRAQERDPRGALQILTQRPRGEQGRKATAVKSQAR